MFITPSYKNAPAAVYDLCYSSLLGIENDRRFHVYPRTRDDFIVMYVTKGCLFCNQYGEAHCLHEREYIFLDLRDRQEYYFDEEIRSEIYWMHMNGGLVRLMAESIARAAPLPLIGKDPSVLESIRHSLDLCAESAEDLWGNSANIASLLFRLLENAHKQSANQTNREERFREEAEKVLSKYDKSRITLSALCDEMHISKYYFSHQFKKYYGASPMKTILGRRMERAKILLLNTDLKIQAIAAECGFTSASNFSAAFHREIGVSPDGFRAQSGSLPRQGKG